MLLDTIHLKGRDEDSTEFYLNADEKEEHTKL